jgi:S-adenosylmethionine uptake transporter
MSELHPRPLVPIAFACAGIGTFSLMDAVMKDLSLGLGAYNAVLWRNSLGALLMGLIFIARRQKWPPAHILKIHLWRSIVVAVMAVSFFWSLTKLPLAEAIGLSFIAPVVALYLAAVMLGETIGREAVWASLAGLGGVVIIMAGRLSGDYNIGHVWGAAAVLFSAVVFAYNLILARQQAQVAGPVEIAFFQNLFVAVTLSLAAPWFLAPFALSQLPMIGGAAALAIISLLLLSWAYARAEAQMLIPVEYTGFIWAAFFGWLFFSEPITAPVLIGTLLIVCGSVIAARAKPHPVNQVEIATV